MAKENKIYVIATIASKGKVFGVRITDLGDRRKKFMDVSIKDLMNVYKSTPNMFKNIAIVNGKLSTLGSNFTVVDFETKKPLVKPLIIVANRLGNLGYTLIDYNGNVKKCNIADTMKIAQTSAFGNAVVSNGILVPTGADFITEAVAIKKDSGLESIGAGLMMDASKKIVGSYRADALNSVGEANIFDGLSDNQIQAIQNYYLWYTSEEYAKLSHNRTFEIKESKGIKLDSIRQDYVWYFGGIVDRGFKGNSKCTLGHPIRYEYIALGYESIKDRETDPKSFKNRVKFGETCSSDFFIIPLDEMRKLVKIRKAMSEEIEAIASAKKKQVYENDDKDWKALWENVELIRNLVDGKNIMQLTKAFGGKVANALMTFRDLDIPFPDSLVNLACNSAYGTEEKMVKSNKARDFWKVIITKELKPLIDWIFDYNKDSYIGDLASCLEFMCCYGLAGNYKYDPLNNTGRRFGAMNKRTRYLRYCMIVPYRKIGVYKFSYTELVNTLSIFSLVKEIEGLLSSDLINIAKSITSYYRLEGTEVSTSSLIVAVSTLTGNNGRYGAMYGRDALKVLFKVQPNVAIDSLSDLLEQLYSGDLLGKLTDYYHYNKGLDEFKRYSSGVNKVDRVLYSNNEVLEIGDPISKFGAYTIDGSKGLLDDSHREVFTLLGSLKITGFPKVGEDIEPEKEDPKANEPEKASTKQEEVSTDKEDKLLVAFRLVPINSDRYEDKIVKDMFNRKLTFDKLSYKQANIVERVINHYTGNGTSDSGLTDEEKSNLDKIIARANVNSDFRVKLDNISSITYEVLNTIKSRDFMSEKQRKHYIKAVEILKNEFSEEESN